MAAPYLVTSKFPIDPVPQTDLDEISEDGGISCNIVVGFVNRAADSSFTTFGEVSLGAKGICTPTGSLDFVASHTVRDGFDGTAIIGGRCPGMLVANYLGSTLSGAVNAGSGKDLATCCGGIDGVHANKVFVGLPVAVLFTGNAANISQDVNGMHFEAQKGGPVKLAATNQRDGGVGIATSFGSLVGGEAGTANVSPVFDFGQATKVLEGMINSGFSSASADNNLFGYPHACDNACDKEIGATADGNRVLVISADVAPKVFEEMLKGNDATWGMKRRLRGV